LSGDYNIEAGTEPHGYNCVQNVIYNLLSMPPKKFVYGLAIWRRALKTWQNADLEVIFNKNGKLVWLVVFFILLHIQKYSFL
jgi:hypothetical protein